jgi:hypothetical protein
MVFGGKKSEIGVLQLAMLAGFFVGFLESEPVKEKV